jgi:hypothetical protein
LIVGDRVIGGPGQLVGRVEVGHCRDARQYDSGHAQVAAGLGLMR